MWFGSPSLSLEFMYLSLWGHFNHLVVGDGSDVFPVEKRISKFPPFIVSVRANTGHKK